ncbi:beta-glucosidase 3-like isoform X3 [Spinacia oleracea]|uniref:Beta-glucosidase 3-like isoform X3 n=1 Tax=Spinacia oleracea TaxID=3562 RepID=A0ABM3QVD2_SPIOL|nr:beta-glucosidase 3-like isoform X3 [Spinacia oleracea]
MGMRVVLWLCLLPLCFDFLRAVAGSEGKEYNRNDFPKDFVFGVSTSAYQVEGAALEDGRKRSIYDTFAHRSNVQLMVETGLDAYRFSISWSRLIPNGRGPVNAKGLRYYNNLINELINHGIEPHVTLTHTDTPQVLEDEYGGFLDPRIIEDYTSYVDVCFREFGDRVRYWTTFNEPNIFAIGGYNVGITPPNRCSSPFGVKCTGGNSSTEPYIVGHTILLAHAYAVRIYKEKYQAKQLGFIGMNLLSYHFSPVTNKSEDVIAVRRSNEFSIGWFMHPLTYGDYPEIMKKNVGSRLPIFSKTESKLVKGSFDFIGINYYTVMKMKDNSISHTQMPRDFYADMAVEWLMVPDTSGVSKELMYPNEAWGLERVLEHYKEVYGNPTIFIHENGQLSNYNTSINDPFRIEYIHDHIGSVLNAVRNGSNTRGYFVWSLLDVYELLSDFYSTFGLYYVDYNDPNLTRHPKLSQKWYSEFLKGNYTTTTGMEINQVDNTTTLDALRYSAS